jgi:hypothetical protein
MEEGTMVQHQNQRSAFEVDAENQRRKNKRAAAKTVAKI